MTLIASGPILNLVMMTATAKPSIASTIAQQLGSRAITMLCCTKRPMAMTRGLCLELAGGSQFNRVMIELAGDDTYTIIAQRYSARRGVVKISKESIVKGVTVDVLHSTLESLTGLRTKI